MTAPFYNGPVAPVVVVDTAAALRAVASNLFQQAQLARIVGVSFFEWQPANTDADDGVNTIKPNDVVMAGRWKLVATGSGGATVFDFVAGTQLVKTTGYQVIGAAEFDASLYAGKTFTFAAELRTTDPTVTSTLRLYNRTDLAVVKADPLVTSTSQDPKRKTSVLASPADLPAANKIYEVHLKQGAASIQAVLCDKAELLIT